MTLLPDLTHMLPRLRRDRLSRELLVRAARVSVGGGDAERRAEGDAVAERPLAVDATAGLCEDSLLLAAWGFEVVMLERNPVVAALAADSLKRAGDIEALTQAVSRMRLREGDAVGLLAALKTRPDVVYLDPMFPKKAHDAAAKKKLQMIQALEQPCEDEAALLAAAKAARPGKVVVKRPAKGDALAGECPSYSVKGKTIRYDCYVL